MSISLAGMWSKLTCKVGGIALRFLYIHIGLSGREEIAAAGAAMLALHTEPAHLDWWAKVGANKHGAAVL